ncbi:MAG: helix-turn-helix transcriptional regulator [Defluviitaleaceae bacterium]|nr:helix-turn-helix transcriptional regulator [Defluviitaleaceae bacterium]MCL2276088.1 helix-turn-helix transcriptional regulator [Defluviitaleaceae bacterium]
MTVLNKMIAIRKKCGMSVSQLSTAMGFHRTYLQKIENEGSGKPPPESVIQQFKLALGAPNLPLTDEEEMAFKQQLYDWKEMSLFNDIE